MVDVGNRRRLHGTWQCIPSYRDDGLVTALTRRNIALPECDRLMVRFGVEIARVNGAVEVQRLAGDGNEDGLSGSPCGCHFCSVRVDLFDAAGDPTWGAAL